MTVSRTVRRSGLLALFAVPLALNFAAPANAATGELTQLAPPASCVSEDGSDGYPDYAPGTCGDGLALGSASSVVVSPDGKSAYVGSTNSVAVFNRNASTGELTQKSGTEACTASDNSGPVATCALGDGLDYLGSLAISPDGKNVYYASGNGIAIFTRNVTTGVLTQTGDSSGCVTEEGKGGHPVYRPGECEDGRALQGVNSIAIAPDGKTLYTTSDYGAGYAGGAVAVFERNTTNGSLAQKVGTAGCVVNDNTLPELGSCAEARALRGATSVAISPDTVGKSLYVSASPYNLMLAVLDRDTGTGALTQKAGAAGCLHKDGSFGCAVAGDIESSTTGAVSPDGKSFYLGLYGSILAFDRETTGSVGALSRLPGTNGCLSSDGTNGYPDFTPGACADGAGIFGIQSLALSPDGRNLYSAAELDSAVAVFDREDGVPPDTTIDTGPTGTITTDQATFSFSGNPAGDTAKIQCRMDTEPFTDCTSPKIFSGLSEGSHTASFRAEDAAGNQDQSPATGTFTVDTTPPDTKVRGSASTKRRVEQQGKKAIVKVEVKLKEDATVRITNMSLLGEVLANWGIDACRPFRLCDMESLSQVLLEWGRPTTLTLRPKTKQQELKIVKALKKGKTLRDQVKLTITDDAGNTETERLKFALKRQPKTPGKKR